MGEERQLRAASDTPISPGAKIAGWAEALEKKAPRTLTHCNRVAAFPTVLAQAMKLNDEEIRAIACGVL
jgi:HD-GYP domain-containing protein (c-di-GMP phosphodiesterase class II)